MSSSGRQIYSANSVIEQNLDDFYEGDDGFDDEPDYEVNAHTADNRGHAKEFFKDNPKLIIGGVKAKDGEILTKKFCAESRKEMITKRCEMNITQTDLADKMKISMDKLKQIEIGMIKPSHKELKAINKELNLTLKFV
jgi:ribosome-binding protein aMBF1 (putative translation factor)